jgi:hypothetical protein
MRTTSISSLRRSSAAPTSREDDVDALRERIYAE